MHPEISLQNIRMSFYQPLKNQIFKSGKKLPKNNYNISFLNISFLNNSFLRNKYSSCICPSNTISEKL